MSWSDFRAAFVRLTIRLNIPTWILQEHTRISQVPDASLYTCHGLITPLTRHNLTITIALHGLRWRYKPRQSELTILGAIPALQDHDSPYGLYISLCTLHLFCSLAALIIFFKEKKCGKVFRSTNSATGATLDTGGWLNLTRQGLTPCKMHQALLDALTLC